MLKFWTAQYRYPGPHRLDITVKGNDRIGKIFAPTWEMVMDYKKSKDEALYIARYHKMILRSYENNRQLWDELLARPYAVLTCFCPEGDFCHRKLLAHYLKQLGAVYEGEITDFSEWQTPKPIVPGPITSFKGNWSGFSNFAPCGFTHCDVFYASVENFYMYYKFSIGDMLSVPNPHALGDDKILVDARNYVATCRNPKKWGRKAKLPWNWEVVKLEAMQIGLEYKFMQNPFYTKLLLSTGDRKLIEGNYWHDNFWGDCTCAKCAHIPGENMLGKMLMAIRKELRSI